MMPLIRWSVVVCLLVMMAEGLAARRPVVLPGARAIVVDERHAVLRERPDLRGEVKQRLRVGRVVGLLATTVSRRGERFHQVAVSRNTRGWILDAAIVRPGSRRDAARLLALVDESADDYARIRLATICAEEFRARPEAPRALSVLAETADRLALRLTRDARRRFGAPPPMGDIPVASPRRALFLNFSPLDRYNRLGVRFDYEADGDRLVYDGAARRLLRRRYPRYQPAPTQRDAEGPKEAVR